MSINSEKQENLLNLSLEVTKEERSRSIDLGVGVFEEEETWELILRYHGSLPEAIEEMEERYKENYRLELLLPGYCLVTVPKKRIAEISSIRFTDYVEKPKTITDQVITIAQGKQAVCVPCAVQPPLSLSGKGVLVGIADSGLDYFLPDFRKEDGSTGVLFLWDQSKTPDLARGEAPPEGFYEGVEYTAEQLDESLSSGEELSFDATGHGTAVAGIAAGSRGVAFGAELLIVKLSAGKKEGFSRTTQLMRALAWMLRKAEELNRPLAVNVSYGSTYGSHDGSSLIETFFDYAASSYPVSIVVGSGNEGAAAGHRQVSINNMETSKVELSIGAFESACSVSLWKNYEDLFAITIRSPAGEEIHVRENERGLQSYVISGTGLSLYYGQPLPYTGIQEVYFNFLGEPYISEGVWIFSLIPRMLTQGTCNFYLPSVVLLSTGTGFFVPNPNVTMTVPSTAQKVITVGAYDPVFREYADFSGRGYPSICAQGQEEFYLKQYTKPDLVAPGVNILVPVPGGGSKSVSGTSFAAPFVTGAAALLMEWGIVRGNDPYLYGEKLKAYLRKGAGMLPGYENFPNPLVGWGSLCVRGSLPV